MLLRPFGSRCDFDVSMLGFGAMRLPTVGEDAARVDEDLATAMLREAVAGGVTYVDTAYVYHAGGSERWLGRALPAVGRDRMRIATKLPTWEVASIADCERIFSEQCDRLQTDHIDVYLLHNLHEGIWPRLRDLGVRQWLDRLRAAGRVTAVGFSFHGGYPLFEELVSAYDWHMCQVQYNYMNEDVQAGTRGVELAAGLGLAVVVMEPLLGGGLAQVVPTLTPVWRAAGVASPAEAALRWVWSRPGIATVLSGMSTLDQVSDNLRSAALAGSGELPGPVASAIDHARRYFRSLDAVPCTRCGYCLPCPQGVAIPQNFQLANDARIFGGNQALLNRNIYAQLDAAARADNCVACGRCEEHCPQHIDISRQLQRVHAELQ